MKINPGYGYNNYFSQGQYLDGWTYQGKTIGTPSITQSVNNRISMIYAGISGNYHGTNFILKSSYTKNLGVYGTPRLDKVLSNYLYLDHSLKNNSRLMIALNLDAGYLTQTNFGLNISYRKIIF